MGRNIQTRQERLKAFWGRRSKVGKAALVLLGLIVLSMFGESTGFARGVDSSLMVLCWMGLTPLVLILLFRWFTYRVLWKVRNRLILTYVLMGLVPVVMFAALMGVAAYMFAGRYSTNVGMEQLNLGVLRVRDQVGSAIVYGSQAAGRGPSTLAKKGTSASGGTSQTGSMDVTSGEDATPLSVMELKGDAWVPLNAADAKTARGPLTTGAPPAWLLQDVEKQTGFQGIVDHAGLLYLCAEVSVPLDGKTVVALGSRPLTREELDVMAKGLGRIVLSKGFSKLADDGNDDTDNDVDQDVAKAKAKGEVKSVHVGNAVNVNVVDPDAMMNAGNFDRVASAPLPGVKHPYLDPPVVFSAPLPVTGWRTGSKLGAMLAVFSRPSYLYALLFASSVQSGKVVWAILIGVAMFFALLEVFALAMATTLSWSITRSVSELYKGTREIDAGHLDHRIPVKRKDQLAALATSFNGMAASVSELMVQQREKERLLNELAIAQEVQTTLFPKSPAVMGTLEVHGTCLPARTVGGDYFDFIFGYGPGYGVEGGPGGHVTLALGDISGKGISAALLMSGLHSADRAFSAAVQDGGAPSPAMLLKLLNSHLYRSTQSARYATLFLATYDPATRGLTYSNGGHLPPLVIGMDGSVQKLEVGGPVVGLLEGMEYEEATVVLQPGDLFVAYTDGLTEPEKDGEDFGEQRLMEFVRARRNEPLTVLAANTLQAVKAWIGSQEQPDDMTIVLARQNS